MTFLELAEQVLKDEKKPLTATEIWQSAVLKGYDNKLNSEGKTPWATLGAQIYVNAKDNPKTPFAQTDTRPKKFYLKGQKSVDFNISPNPVEPVLKKKKFEYLERDLHAYLSYYAYYHLRCYTKTINHSQSSKKEFKEWVHPDIVGCYYPLDEWKSEVYELSSAIGNVSIKLLSFELKRELHFGNLRESFFQTVSNSSWANESYLVASKISKETDFVDELTRLSTSFGIGIIILNVDDPHSSEILLPAKYRETLDWETINKLTMNTDFKEFLTRVKIDISSKKIHKKEYDTILDTEDLKKTFKAK
ncbi:COG2958 family protein [Segetibacter koreensis]|uniref:COG2958 family protein n=1 Tax=Segetibacter koreensis TaxID=398037 RepID=UPI00035D7204|nr:HTH domain-containing protein [Segetibacter koreensis]